MARLLEAYRTEILPKLKDECGRANAMSLPKLEKVCLNMGVGKALDDAKALDEAVSYMKTIAGQAPVVTTARISVSNFKLRQGYRIGCRVTLRGQRMYEFIDRLVNAAMPRIRDFRGVSPHGFDRFGNYSMGVDEITIFPEIDPDRAEYPQGMDITFVIRNAQSAAEGRALLRHLGMPFRES